jgi:ABC-type cobalamin/Fe3+-siderophores transport system ATPase subunit
LLRIENLKFKGILKGITTNIDKGEVIALVGKNGAGKTTFMKCICGFLNYSGKVTIDGKEISRIQLKERIRKINYLPQHLEIPFPCTVLEFLKLSFIPLKGLFPSISRNDESKIRKSLERFGIDHLINTEIHNLSGGERAKVLLSRILLIDPDYYLLDEPGAFLDIGIITELSKLIDYAKRRGKTVLITAHDVNLLVDIAERFLCLKNGKLIIDGTKNDFLNALPEIFDAPVKVRKLEGEIFIKPILRR